MEKKQLLLNKQKVASKKYDALEEQKLEIIEKQTRLQAEHRGYQAWIDDLDAHEEVKLNAKETAANITKDVEEQKNGKTA